MVRVDLNKPRIEGKDMKSECYKNTQKKKTKSGEESEGRGKAQGRNTDHSVTYSAARVVVVAQTDIRAVDAVVL